MAMLKLRAVIKRLHYPGAFVAWASRFLVRHFKSAALPILVIAASVSAASAETLLMPDRDMQTTVSEVVWGITTLPNGSSTYDIDFGDGSAHASGTVGDRSYIAVNHTYALAAANLTVTLKVTNGATVETATATVNVYNRAALTADAARELDINRTIQNGLRYLWYAQSNRTTFDTNIETRWGSYNSATTALAVQAFQNQGYRLPNGNIAPTGIYAKYAVRRGMNFMLGRLTFLNVSSGANGPACSSGPTAPFTLPSGTECNALYADTSGYEGYENGMVMFAIAGSGALSRTNAEAGPVTAGYVDTRTQSLGQILQRIVNASAWGQQTTGSGQGGWIYSFHGGDSDGSTAGWELLGLLDAGSVGALVPSWVSSTWASHALPNATNTDGSFDYRTDSNPASDYIPNMAKTGIGLQGMFFAGYPASDSRVLKAQSWMATDWPSASLSNYNCSGSTDNFNATYGCAYGMFNAFKGLKLYGVATLPGIGYVPPAGTSILPDDWYAAEVDWLVAHQTSPTVAAGGGYWGNLFFSGAWGGDAPTTAAMAELILAPTALVLPDPEEFATVGLQQGTPLSINPATNPVTSPPGTHTVTGITVSSGGTPIPGVTITFKVLTGPNAGATGTGVTGTNGQATFTYTDSGGAGDDTIQANVGALTSNILVKHWVVPVATCDMNNDSKIDITDIKKIQSLVNTTPSSSNWDPRADADFNGIVNSVDARMCVLRCTKTACAP